jgi:hypothetical protein
MKWRSGMGKVLKFQTQEQLIEEKMDELAELAYDLSKKWKPCPYCEGIESVYPVVTEGWDRGQVTLFAQVCCLCGETLENGEFLRVPLKRRKRFRKPISRGATG